MPQVAANGHTFHVQRLGQSGPPVAMLHGLLLGSMASWYFTAAPALARFCRVMLYDLRGHGRTPHAESGYDLATMSADLAALAADHRREPLVLVGHSYGALVALRFALDHPHRVGGLVLVEAPLPPSRFGEFSEFLRRSPKQMIDALPVATRELFARPGRQVRRLLEQLTRLTSQSTLIADLEAETDVPDAALAHLRCPTLCVYGTDSACLDVGHRFARVVPSARLEILPGGHYLHLDSASRLTELIVDFVSELAGDGDRLEGGEGIGG